MTFPGFETTPKAPRIKPSREHLESMRPRARQIVEAFASNITGHSYGDRVAQNVSFYMQEARHSNPEVFDLISQEVKKLPRTSAQQLMMRIINSANGRSKLHGKRHR